jgi:hypothetical protein
METRFTVGHKVYQEGATDAHGNPVDGWAASVPLAVFAIYPRFSEEPAPDRPLVVVGKAVLAPTGTTVGPKDLLVIDGEDWKVEGEPADWTTGPFGFTPGVEIVLTRAEG